MAAVREGIIERVASQAELSGSYLVLMAAAGVLAAAAALAAGIAGALALAQNKTDTIVGTVAALALVPAAAAAGIAFMSHDPSRGTGGLVLLGINVGLIIVTGIVTLLILRPDEGEAA